MHLVLMADDLEADVERLVQLGARVVGSAEDGDVELADPDGNELHVRRA